MWELKGFVCFKLNSGLEGLKRGEERGEFGTVGEFGVVCEFGVVHELGTENLGFYVNLGL